MNTKEMATLFASLIVGLIVLVTALVPIIDVSTDDYRELYNNSSANLSSVLMDDMDIQIEDDKVTVNGDDIALSSPTGLRIVTDSFHVIETGSNLEFAYKGNNNLTLVSTITIAVNDSVASVTYTDTSSNSGNLSFPIEWGFVIDPNGDYGLLRYYDLNRTIYIKDINELYGSNRLVTTNSWFSFHGADVTIGDSTKVVADYALQDINGYEGAYRINIGQTGTGYTFTIDNNGEPYVIHPWIYVAPNEVVAYKTGTSIVIPMLFVLPIFVAIGLIVGTVRAFRRE